MIRDRTGLMTYMDEKGYQPDLDSDGDIVFTYEEKKFFLCYSAELEICKILSFYKIESELFVPELESIAVQMTLEWIFMKFRIRSRDSLETSLDFHVDSTEHLESYLGKYLTCMIAGASEFQEKLKAREVQIAESRSGPFALVDQEIVTRIFQRYFHGHPGAINGETSIMSLVMKDDENLAEYVHALVALELTYDIDIPNKMVEEMKKSTLADLTAACRKIPIQESPLFRCAKVHMLHGLLIEAVNQGVAVKIRGNDKRSASTIAWRTVLKAAREWKPRWKTPWLKR